MSDWSESVLDTLLRLSRLPQVRCAFVDPFMWPQGFSQQCRIFDENGEWMIELARERRGTLSDFFAGMEVALVNQDDLQVVQGTNRYGMIREIGPSAQGWYNAEQWELVQRELRANG